MKRGDFVQEECCCVMIVSTNNKVIDFIKTFLPQNKFYPVIVSANAAEARRTLRRTPIDIVIIDTPLPDEFGTKLAEDMSKECAVAVIVKPRQFEDLKKLLMAVEKKPFKNSVVDVLVKKINKEWEIIC